MRKAGKGCRPWLCQRQRQPAGDAHGVEPLRQLYPQTLSANVFCRRFLATNPILSTQRIPHSRDVDFIYTNFRGRPDGESDCMYIIAFILSYQVVFFSFHFVHFITILRREAILRISRRPMRRNIWIMRPEKWVHMVA